MSQKNSKVNAFVKAEKKWTKEIELLREIVLDCGLDEEFKWGLPCYAMNSKNIAIIQNFKESCALMFFKGFALKDPKGLLKAPGENSQTARRLEFSSAAEVTKQKTLIKNFIKEAIKAEEAGVKVEKKPAKAAEAPPEFQKVLKENKKLKAAFEGLTPGRQRLYLMHFASAKQSATRVARIEKCLPKILKGLGLNE